MNDLFGWFTKLRYKVRVNEDKWILCDKISFLGLFYFKVVLVDIYAFGEEVHLFEDCSLDFGVSGG